MDHDNGLDIDAIIRDAEQYHREFRPNWPLLIVLTLCAGAWIWAYVSLTNYLENRDVQNHLGSAPALYRDHG